MVLGSSQLQQIKKLLLSTLIGFIYLVYLPSAFAQEDQEPTQTTVNFWLVQAPDQSLNEVKEELLNDARVQAVQQVSGVRVESIDASAEVESVQSYFNSFRRLMRQSVRGRIVEEEEPRYSISGDTVSISFTATVQEVSEELDPYFKIGFSSNKKVYTVGETIQFELEATKDSYITLFSVKEDNSIAMFFPNQYLTENYVKGGIQRTIPNEQERSIIDFTAQPEPGKEYYSELIYAVATKEKYEFEELASELTYENDWITLNKWLLDLDRDQWTEAFLHIQVFNK
jgi:hypothetical protein